MYCANRTRRRPVSAATCLSDRIEMKLSDFTAALDEASDEKRREMDCLDVIASKQSDGLALFKERSRKYNVRRLERNQKRDAFEANERRKPSTSYLRRTNTLPLPHKGRDFAALSKPRCRRNDEVENAHRKLSRSKTSDDINESKKKSNLSLEEIRVKYSNMSCVTAVPVKEKVALMESWGRPGDQSLPKSPAEKVTSTSSTDGQPHIREQLNMTVKSRGQPAPQTEKMVVSSASRLKPPTKPPAIAGRRAKERRSMSDPNLQKSFQAMKELWDKKIQADSKPQIPSPSRDHKTSGNSTPQTQSPTKVPVGKRYNEPSNAGMNRDTPVMEKKTSSPTLTKPRPTARKLEEDRLGGLKKKDNFQANQQALLELNTVKNRAKMFDVGAESVTRPEPDRTSLTRNKNRPAAVDEAFTSSNVVCVRRTVLEGTATGQEKVSSHSVNNNENIRGSDLARLLDFECTKEADASEDLMSSMRRNSANLAKERRRHARKGSNHSDSDSSCSVASSLSSTSVEGPVVLRRCGSRDDPNKIPDRAAPKGSPVVKSYLHRNESPKSAQLSPTQAARPPSGSLPERRASAGSVASSGSFSRDSPVAARRQSSLHKERSSPVIARLEFRGLGASPTSALHRKLSLDASKAVRVSADSGTGTVSPGMDRNSRASTKSLGAYRDSDVISPTEDVSRSGGSLSLLSSLSKDPPTPPSSCDKPSRQEDSASPLMQTGPQSPDVFSSLASETPQQRPRSGCITLGPGVEFDNTLCGSTTTISSRMSLLSELGQGNFNAEDEYNRIVDDLAASTCQEEEPTKENEEEATTDAPAKLALASRDSLEIPSRKSRASDNDSYSDYDPSDVDDDGNQMARTGSVESNHSADAAAPAKKVPVEEKLRNIAKELLTTEATYVDVLHLIDQIFHKRVLEAINRKQISSDVKNIFSNVSAIYQFHREYLLPQLQARIQTWEANPKLGDIMTQAAPFLKMYSLYVQNFDDAMTMIRHWSEKSHNFANIMKQTQAEKECRNLSLEHHMLGPVQRIPRYKMLLDDYLKRLPEDSPDRPDAETALRLISQAATHSNESMRQSDKFNKLLSIYNNLVDIDFDIVDVSRELIMDGKIIKISARNGEKHERYLYLFNDMLLCCTPLRRLQRKSYKVTARIDLDGMKITDIPNMTIPNTFCVCGTRKSMEFATNTLEAKQKWVSAINDAIDSFLERKTSFMKSGSQRKNTADGQPTGTLLAKSDSHPQLTTPPRSRSPRQRPISFEDAEAGSDEKRVEITCTPGSHHYVVDIEDHELGKRAPRWIKDNEVTMCMNCSKAFNRLLRRRHHCRACGRVICTECSERKLELQYEPGKPHKVCNKCLAILTGRKTADADKKGVLEIEADIVSEDSVISEYLHFTESEKRKPWMKMWCVIPKNEPCLYVYRAHQDVRAVMTMPLPGFTIVQDSSIDREFSFKLIQTRKVLLFAASSQEQKDRWKFVFERSATGEVPTREEVFNLSWKAQEDLKEDLQEEASCGFSMVNGSRMSSSSAEYSNVSASSSSDCSSRPSSLMDQANSYHDVDNGVSRERERFFEEAVTS